MNIYTVLGEIFPQINWDAIPAKDLHRILKPGIEYPEFCEPSKMNWGATQEDWKALCSKPDIFRLRTVYDGYGGERYIFFKEDGEIVAVWENEVVDYFIDDNGEEIPVIVPSVYVHA